MEISLMALLHPIEDPHPDG